MASAPPSGEKLKGQWSFKPKAEGGPQRRRVNGDEPTSAPPPSEPVVVQETLISADQSRSASAPQVSSCVSVGLCCVRCARVMLFRSG